MLPISHSTALRWSAVLIAPVALSSVPLALTSAIGVAVVALVGLALAITTSQLARTVPALAAQPSRTLTGSGAYPRPDEPRTRA